MNSVQFHLTSREVQLVRAMRRFLIRNLKKIPKGSLSKRIRRRKQHQLPQDEEEFYLRQERLESLTDKLPHRRVLLGLDTQRAVPESSKPQLQPSPLSRRKNAQPLQRPAQIPQKKGGIIFIQPLLNGDPENRVTTQAKLGKGGSKRRITQEYRDRSTERRNISSKRPRKDPEAANAEKSREPPKVEKRNVRVSTKRHRKMVISSSENESDFEDGGDIRDLNFDPSSVLVIRNSTSSTRRIPQLPSKRSAENGPKVFRSARLSAPVTVTGHNYQNKNTVNSNAKAPKTFKKTTISVPKQEARVIKALVNNSLAGRNVDNRTSFKPSAIVKPMQAPVIRKPITSAGEIVTPHATSSRQPNSSEIDKHGKSRKDNPGLQQKQAIFQTLSPYVSVIKKASLVEDKDNKSTAKPTKSKPGNLEVVDIDTGRAGGQATDHPDDQGEPCRNPNPFSGLRPRPLLFLDKHFIRTHKCFLPRNYRKMAQKEWEGFPISHSSLNLNVKSYLTMDKETFAAKQSSLEECVAQIVTHSLLLQKFTMEDLCTRLI